MGSAVALYQFANGMQRRGHEVHVVHVGFVAAPDGSAIWVDEPIRDVEDLTWIGFDPGLAHHVVGGPMDWSVVPDGDVVVQLDPPAPRRCGRSVTLLQGFGILPPDMEDSILGAPSLKVCTARWLVDVALTNGVPEAELAYVPYGLDHRKYSLTTPRSSRPLRVAMYHSNHPAKGADQGIEALEQVRRELPDAQFVAFGNERPATTLPEWLTFHHDPPQDVLVGEIYNGSRVFLFPSVQEGFGLPCIEAMSCGAALVTTANGGSEDYAFHGDTALVSPPFDPGALAEHVVQLLRDEACASRIARRARQYVRRFDWDLSAALFEEVLEAHAELDARAIGSV